MISCELWQGLGMRLSVALLLSCLGLAQLVHCPACPALPGLGKPLISSATSFSALGLMALGCVRGLLEGHANLQCAFLLGATEAAARSS